MRKLELCTIASILVIGAGCMNGTPGGPGVQSAPGSQEQTTNKPVITDSRDSFVMRTPVLSTSLKQGESTTASIVVSRGSDFKDDVELSFTGMPAGVTIEPSMAKMGVNDKELQIKITAAPDAAAGDFTATVTGHPAKGGPDATNQLKLTISAK